MSRPTAARSAAAAASPPDPDARTGGHLIHARTIPELFLARADKDPERIFAYRKEADRWVGHTWAESRRELEALVAGLASLGVARGDRVGILSETRAEWSGADAAILFLGGVTVGAYATSTGDQVRYLLEHSGTRVIFVEDATQWDKVHPFAAELDLSVVSFDPVPGAPEVADFEALQDRGRERREQQPVALETLAGQVQPDDLATIVYTSGTTGPPKGAMLTHGNLVAAATAASRVLPISEDDVSVPFLPLAHSLQRQSNYAGLITGATGYFNTSIANLMQDFAEVRPTVQPSVPRIWEKFHARLQARLQDASPVRRCIARWAFDVAARHGRLRRAGEPIPWALQARYRLADRLVYRKLRDVFGGRVKFLVSGGAPISMGLLEFFDDVGLRIYEGWGLTETAAPHTVNHPGAWRFGTVGQPLPGCEVRIAADGEVEVFGDNVFTGYYRDEEATRAAFTEDGWFATGDIGELDADGYLRITDRKKDLIVTSGGKNVAPQNIENLLRQDPLVSQAVVIGDRRKYLAALITLDDEETAPWAAARGLPGDPAGLARHPDVERHVRRVVDEANARLAGYEQVKRFRILERDLTQEAGELTPTLKVKRRTVDEHFADEIEALYEQTAAT